MYVGGLAKTIIRAERCSAGLGADTVVIRTGYPVYLIRFSMQTLPAQRVSALRPGTIKITRTAALQPATPLSALIRRKQQRLLTVTQMVAHVQVTRAQQHMMCIRSPLQRLMPAPSVPYPCAQVPVRAGFYGARDNKPPSRPGSGPNWLNEVRRCLQQPPAGPPEQLVPRLDPATG